MIDAPEPGQFCTRQALQAYSFLPCPSRDQVGGSAAAFLVFILGQNPQQSLICYLCNHLQVEVPGISENAVQEVPQRQSSHQEFRAQIEPIVVQNMHTDVGPTSSPQMATHSTLPPTVCLPDVPAKEANHSAVQLQPAGELAPDQGATEAAQNAQVVAAVHGDMERERISSPSAADTMEEGQVSDVLPPADAEQMQITEMSDEEGQCLPQQQQQAEVPTTELSDEEGQCSPHRHQASAAVNEPHVPLLQAPYVSKDSAASLTQPYQQPLLHVRTANPQGQVKPTQNASLAQRLNPNNPAFDPVFAEKHRAKRLRTDATYAHSMARKEKKKLLKRVHWSQKSSLSPQEHCYLLDLQGKSNFIKS